MKLKLHNRKVFVDSNAFIYFFTGQANDLTCEIFNTAALGEVKVITSTRVIDEVLFKLICLEANRKFGFTSNIPRKLRESKERVKSLSYVYEVLFQFIEDINAQVLTVDSKVIAKSKKVMDTYGLFGNDAITVTSMKSRNLKYILTADKNFSVVSDIVAINPL